MSARHREAMWRRIGDLFGEIDQLAGEAFEAHMAGDVPSQTSPLLVVEMIRLRCNEIADNLVSTIEDLGSEMDRDDEIDNPITPLPAPPTRH